MRTPWARRREKEARRQRIIADLTALQGGYWSVPPLSGFVGDMILFAEISPSRMDLPDSYVADVRARCEDMLRMCPPRSFATSLERGRAQEAEWDST